MCVSSTQNTTFFQHGSPGLGPGLRQHVLRTRETLTFSENCVPSYTKHQLLKSLCLLTKHNQIPGNTQLMSFLAPRAPAPRLTLELLKGSRRQAARGTYRLAPDQTKMSPKLSRGCGCGCGCGPALRKTNETLPYEKIVFKDVAQ